MTLVVWVNLASLFTGVRNQKTRNLKYKQQRSNTKEYDTSD